MDEPDRMCNQTDSILERALLEEGRRYQGPEDLRAHTLAAMGLAATAGVTVGGIVVWLAAKTWTTKLLLAASTMTLLTAIPVSYVLLHERPRSAATAPAPALVPPTEHERLPSSALAAPDEVVPAQRPVETAETPPSAPRATASASALRAELAALDAVRSTLGNDDAAGALSFLDAYFRTFPRGRLHLEAEVLRIDALAKSGKLASAKKHAQDFIKRHPNSVLTARVAPYALR